jgi:cytochrome c peroxidase
MNRHLLFGLVLGVGILSLGRSDPLSMASLSQAPASSGKPRDREPIKPISAVPNLDVRKVALGRALFHETQLSHDNTISCASCHDLAKGGADGRARSIGIHQTEGAINAPTVFNSGLNFKQFWDGRVATLEAQVDGPLLAAGEMGATWEEVVGKLRAIPRYADSFQKIFADGIQPQNIRSAIAEFERSLTTPNSRFDRYLRGDDAALTAEEKAGYQEFKAHGCSSCHQGVNVGGNMFETFGAMADYFGARGHVTKADAGRFNVTGREEDRFVFKVPSLRNVALTGPYFHDGSAAHLEDAVKVMGIYQLGQSLSESDIDLIAKFLKTLTGEYGGKLL